MKKKNSYYVYQLRRMVSLYSMKITIRLIFLLAVLLSLNSLIPQGTIIKQPLLWCLVILILILSASLLLCLLNRLRSLQILTHYGSFIFHLSILVILIGAVASHSFAASSQIRVGAGESLNLSKHGFTNYSVTLHDFQIDYYDNLAPKQYISNLSLDTPANKIITDKITVNKPLNYKGLKIYQNSYSLFIDGNITYGGKSESFSIITGTEIILDASDTIRLKTQFFPHYGEEIDNPRLVGILMENGNPLQTFVLAKGEVYNFGEEDSFVFLDYKYYSTLIIKKDPGINIIFMGFVLMVIGLSLRYISLKVLFTKK